MTIASVEDSSAREAVSLSNWKEQPFNRWSFHNVSELIPSAVIASAASSPLQDPGESHAFSQFNLPTGNGTSLNMERFLTVTATDGIVILRDGQVVFEQYANGMTAHTRHILMSGTKSVVGLLVGILHGRGELDPDVLVSQFVPEIIGTAYNGATIRHLLDMRTGIVFNGNELQAYETATNWRPLAEGDTPLDLHGFLAQTPASDSKPHGGPFSYISANTDLLGWVIERSSGKPLATLISELFWKPIGADDDAYITLDREGAPRATGGLCATTRDFARVGQLILDKGHREGVEVVPSTWIDDIFEQGDREAWQNGEFSAFNMDMSYRSGWYSIHERPERLFAMGTYGQNLFIDKSNRIVVAKLSSQAAALDFQAMALTHRAVAEIARCLKS